MLHVPRHPKKVKLPGNKNRIDAAFRTYASHVIGKGKSGFATRNYSRLANKLSRIRIVKKNIALFKLNAIARCYRLDDTEIYLPVTIHIHWTKMRNACAI